MSLEKDPTEKGTGPMITSMNDARKDLGIGLMINDLSEPPEIIKEERTIENDGTEIIHQIVKTPDGTQVSIRKRLGPNGEMSGKIIHPGNISLN